MPQASSCWALAGLTSEGRAVATLAVDQVPRSGGIPTTPWHGSCGHPILQVRRLSHMSKVKWLGSGIVTIELCLSMSCA